MKNDTALLRQALEALEERLQFTHSDLTVMAVEALRKRLNLCPACGAETRFDCKYPQEIELSYYACTQCKWVENA
jgi:hypothetical protein